MTRVLGYTLDVSVSAVSNKARCVVWSPVAAQPPSGLLVALGAKGLSVEHAADAYTAVAAVLKKTTSNEVVVLVVVDPASQPRFEETMAMLDRYAPRAARWTYNATAKPPLQIARPRAYSRSTANNQARVPAEVQTEPKPTARPTASQSGPMLRLTGLGVLGGGEHSTSRALNEEPPSAPNHEAGSFLGDESPSFHTSPESILTREEMAALLADDDHNFEGDFEGGLEGDLSDEGSRP